MAPGDATYDKRGDAAYIHLGHLREGEILQDIVIEDTPPGVTMILDFDSNNLLVGLEVLGASNALPADVLATYRRIDVDGAPPITVDLLRKLSKSDGPSPAT